MSAPRNVQPTRDSEKSLCTMLTSILPIVVAIVLYYVYQQNIKADIPTIITALELRASKTQPNLTRVSVGYNSNLDLIVHDALDLVKSMGLIPRSQVNHESIASRTQLEETMSYFFARGSAGERFVEDAVLFDEIISASKALEKKHYFIGGNSALMAQRFAQKNCAVHLGGAIGSTLAGLLHKSIWTSGNKDVVDEVHLILEYKKGSTWGDLQAPRANRFIIVRDLTNGVLAPLESFHDDVTRFNPQLLIVAGLHLLEGQTPTLRTKRLNDVVAGLQRAPNGIPLHFELASIGSKSYLKERLNDKLLNTILPHVDSLGLNEQELGTSYLALAGDLYNTSHFVQPTPQVAADALYTVMTSSAGKTRLSRIHFHSLSFHIIALRNHQRWGKEKAASAVAAASLATTKQACDSEVIDPTFVDVLLPATYTVNTENGMQRFWATEGVVNWTFGDVSFYLAPVLVCRAPTKTVGLGDIISATGLLYSY